MPAQRALRWLLRTAEVLVAAALIAVAAGYVVARRSVFRPGGDPIALAGLAREASVVFDRYGVGHVRAASVEDALVVEGYVHARERFFQMELNRRAVFGRLAELFGRRALPRDREMRRYGVAELAARHLRELDGASRALLASYVRGVNAAVAERGASGLAPELLALSAEVEPWREEDTLGLDMLFFITQAAGREEYRAEILHALGAQRAADLWGWSAAQAREWIPADLANTEVVPERHPAAAPSVGAGSNNWAIAPARSLSGFPVFAYDPHLGVSNPALWYEIALEAPGLHVAGASFAGVPGVLIGHNADVAWGFTYVQLDDADLYRVQLDVTGTRERLGSDFRPLKVRRETIRVRGGEAEELTVKLSRHGPIVRERNGEALALAWTALIGRSSLPAFVLLDRARTVTEAAAAFAAGDPPAFNLVAADRAGHIRWQVIGRVPVRGRGAGRLPAPGWDSSWDWQGLAPYASNPFVEDPAPGFVVTANHDPFAEGDFSRPGYPGEFAPPWRVRAIRAALAARRTWDVAGCQALQMDDTDGLARAIIARLAPLLDRIGTAPARSLRAWDGRMSRASRPALLWAEFLRELTRRIGGDEAKRAGLRSTPLDGEDILRLLDGRMNPLWWDDVSTTAVETPEQIVAAALAAAARRAGDATWGSRHTVLFAHPLGGIPLLGALLNRGPFPVPGSPACVNANAYSSRAENFAVVQLPSLRFVADLADWDRAVFTLPLGQSGHFLSPHAADQTGDWLAGRAHPMPWSDAEVQAATVAKLDLRPVNSPLPGDTPGRSVR
jgi:acyl-homoserine lactone acylase PvdQ